MGVRRDAQVAIAVAPYWNVNAGYVGVQYSVNGIAVAPYWNVNQTINRIIDVYK